jgi:hypothetical protein
MLGFFPSLVLDIYSNNMPLSHVRFRDIAHALLGQEYGGGISHFGSSSMGRISDNWILWNRAVDEGGGVIIASETLPVDSQSEYPTYAGSVVIEGNVIQGCISGDDGGGLRFLNPGGDSTSDDPKYNSIYTVKNNVITHNVAMHSGGGVSINDAPYVYFTDNIVMNNIVTGTSVESSKNELPAAGLDTNALSQVLAGRLSDEYINLYGGVAHPQDFFDNVFWDNRASNGATEEFPATPGTPASIELKGLAMTHADEWHVDMKANNGVPLLPTDSVLQNLGDFYADKCLTSLSYLPEFFNTLPFECDGTLSTVTFSPVKEEVKWGSPAGSGLEVRVLGTAATLAGSNTFIVVPTDAFSGGPLGNYEKQTNGLIILRQRHLRKTRALVNNVTATQEASPVLSAPRHLAGDYKSGKNTSYLFLTTLAAVFFLLALFRQLLWTGQKQKEQKQTGNQSGGGFYRLLVWLLFTFGLLKGINADGNDCVIGCVSDEVPIPSQIKYQTYLFLPKVLDLRSDSTEPCPAEVPVLNMYMKEGFQDWGVKGSNGTPLNTTIWGYVIDVCVCVQYT